NDYKAYLDVDLEHIRTSLENIQSSLVWTLKVWEIYKRYIKESACYCGEDTHPFP
ncbi:MAG: hypothetical protein LQ345_006745, partial [Seirophora villosa]